LDKLFWDVKKYIYIYIYIYIYLDMQFNGNHFFTGLILSKVCQKYDPSTQTIKVQVNFR